jgi:hypothetical protein
MSLAPFEFRSRLPDVDIDFLIVAHIVLCRL